MPLYIELSFITLAIVLTLVTFFMPKQPVIYVYDITFCYGTVPISCITVLYESLSTVM